MRVILSGGGTGGHIYPAVAVAEALERRLGKFSAENPDGVEILFVGALGRMEMEKVPALGYRIVGLPTAGLHRKLDWRNLLLPFKIAKSLRLARRVVRDFGADVVVGFGGYASAPVLRAAQSMGVPTVIQEQNSYAGLANKLLAKRARAICVAYEGMERFFPADRIVRTGNPLRGAFSSSAHPPRGEDASFDEARKWALEYFGFSPGKPVLLVVGGSLGSRTFNDMMKRWVGELLDRGDVQVIWQTGKIYAAEMDEFISDHGFSGNPVCRQSNADFAPTAGASEGIVRKGALLSRQTFIENMAAAYSAADLVVSRSGAGTVSELALLGKPTLFVPSPNVAEDHQTKNAMALVERGAAMICPDGEAVERAVPMAMELLADREKLASLQKNIATFATPDAADKIAGIIINH